MRLEQRIVKAHSPIKNPELTESAEGKTGELDDILEIGKLSPYEKMIQMEAILLSRWKYANKWRDCLDSPLIAHLDAALVLRELHNYEAVVGIQKAGISYAKIFEIAGFPIFDINFSHHKRHMEKPEIDEDKIKELNQYRNILITDIDFVTGKTLREVTRYLREKGVNIKGAYIGLSEWPGIETNEPQVGDNTVNFETFWRTYGGRVRHLRNMSPYKEGIIPSDLLIFNSNPRIGENEILGAATARRIAQYLKSL